VETGSLAVAGQTAVLGTNFAIMVVDARTGARRSVLPAAQGCTYQQVAASATAIATLANCTSGASVTVLDPATGRQAWHALLPGGSGPVPVTMLSASPVVIANPGQGPDGSLRVRVVGPGGTVSASFLADLRSPRFFGNASFPSTVTVAGGLLVGTAGSPVGDMEPVGSAVAAYRLSDGRQQWRAAVPTGVADIGFTGGEAVIVDESGPAYALRGINLGTGDMRLLGRIPPGDVAVGASGLYSVAGRYLIVNWGNPSVAAFPAPQAQFPPSATAMHQDRT
jgi:hypothetical protein